MKYKIVYKMSGEDEVDNLDSDNLDDARKEVEEFLKNTYSHEQYYRPQNMILIKDWEPVDTEGFYGPMDLKDKLETQQEEMEEMEEKKRLYEKLKKIFEPKPDEVE